MMTDNTSSISDCCNSCQDSDGCSCCCDLDCCSKKLEQISDDIHTIQSQVSGDQVGTKFLQLAKQIYNIVFN